MIATANCRVRMVAVPAIAAAAIHHGLMRVQARVKSQRLTSISEVNGTSVMKLKLKRR